MYYGIAEPSRTGQYTSCPYLGTVLGGDTSSYIRTVLGIGIPIHALPTYIYIYIYIYMYIYVYIYIYIYIHI